MGESPDPIGSRRNYIREILPGNIPVRCRKARALRAKSVTLQAVNSRLLSPYPLNQLHRRHRGRTAAIESSSATLPLPLCFPDHTHHPVLCANYTRYIPSFWRGNSIHSTYLVTYPGRGERRPLSLEISNNHHRRRRNSTPDAL